MIRKKWVICAAAILVGFFFVTAGGLVAEEIEFPDFIELDQDLYGSNDKELESLWPVPGHSACRTPLGITRQA